MTQPKRTEVRALPWLAVAAAALLLSGCLRTPEPPGPPQEEDGYLSGPSGEPLEIEYTFPGDDAPTLITAELYDGMVLIEGDIALGTLEELTSASKALTTESHGVPTNYWPAATTTAPYVYEVPYVISDKLNDDHGAFVADFILPAIEHWNTNTNLELVPRSGEADYIEFVAANAKCWSRAGRKGGRQEIRLDVDGCDHVDTVIHEIGHAIGLKHEQQRSDRDEFVEIIWDNITPGKEGNFTIYGSGLPLGGYGYTSIMHYEKTAFGIRDENGIKLTTIRSLGDPVDPAPRLTAGDLAAVRRLYPELDPPFVAISQPAQAITVDEGVEVTFEADAVIAPELAASELILSWSYERAGVPFVFASVATGEAVEHTFCDGRYDVTVEAFLSGEGFIATDTVRVNVNDLGSTGPPPECDISITIDEPLPGAVFVEGGTIPLSAVIADDHPETDLPLYTVIWRLNDPVDGTIISTGLEGSTKRGAGEHTFYVTYGAAVDSVTVSVVAAGTPPTAQVLSPADESLHNWLDIDGVNTYLDISFSSSASDAEDGTLSGSSLVWETRRENVGSFEAADTGPNPTIRFPLANGTVRYDVRLTATDSDGMTASTTIQVIIVWPPA